MISLWIVDLVRLENLRADTEEFSPPQPHLPFKGPYVLYAELWESKIPVQGPCFQSLIVASPIFSFVFSPSSLELISPAPAQGGALALRMGEPLLSPLALFLREWRLLSSPSTLQGLSHPAHPPGCRQGRDRDKLAGAGPPTELRELICLVP